jgi:hypothetical protein
VPNMAGSGRTHAGGVERDRSHNVELSKQDLARARNAGFRALEEKSVKIRRDFDPDADPHLSFTLRSSNTSPLFGSA